MIFQERTYSVLLVSASEKFRTAMQALLPMTDYYPVVFAGSTGEARRRFSEAFYDLAVILSPLPDEFGSRLAMDICRSSDTGVLLMVKKELYDDVYAKVMDQGVMVLPVPASTQMISQSLRMLCASRERLRRMEEKQATVEEKIAEIRLVNRAKWALIEQLHITEAEAHRIVEKTAMDLRLSRREVADRILKDPEGFSKIS
ncbi:MAG: ANTAR domain-containing protein [Lachnospiraceae bacterium]|nr:ANTAR domain-containing protein [Lachnospiraceae bacterium]